MIRVLIVEDSPTAALLLKIILESDPDIQVVGSANNGQAGLHKTKEIKPDLITMDIHMPGMDGFEATRRIMEECPTPIVIISSSFDPAEVKLSFETLEAGALAILPKPVGPGSPHYQSEAAELIQTIKLMAEIKVVRRRNFSSKPKALPPVFHIQDENIEIIAIAASTGGPTALASLLAELPGDIPVPILIVQHIAEGFDGGLAGWLGMGSKLTVKLAEDGQLLRAGQALIAPQGKQMGISSSKRIILDGRIAPIGGFCPSASYMFQSISRVYGSRAVGVVLTGMGSDGASGLVSLHNAGGRVIAQDEASCVVYGMPGAAVALGAVDMILPLNKISQELEKLYLPSKSLRQPE